MVLVLNVDDAPSVLTTSNQFAVDGDVLLRTHNSEGNKTLDVLCQCALLVVVLVAIVGEHAKVVELELLLYTLLESHALLERQRVGLGDDGNNVHNVRELLEDDNVDGF